MQGVIQIDIKCEKFNDEAWLDSGIYELQCVIADWAKENEALLSGGLHVKPSDEASDEVTDT